MPLSRFCPVFVALVLLSPLFRFSARAASSDEVVTLPPLLVEEKLRGPRWRYAELPGFEILARCSDARARALAYSYYRAHHLQSVLLPDRFLGQFDVPTKLIFYADELWPAALEEGAALLRSSSLVPSLPRRAATGDPTPLDQLRAPDPIMSRGRIPIYSAGWRAETDGHGEMPAFVKDLRLSDDDEVVIFNVVRPEPDFYFRTFLRPTYLAQLLAARTPTLPSWFVRGFLDFYQQLEFSEDTITAVPFVFLDSAQSATAKEDSATAIRTWLPLMEVFTEDSARLSARSVEANQIASAQLHLFIRWALDPAAGTHRDALWRLVDEACHAPVTAERFTQAFGSSPSEIEKALADYLPRALRHSVQWQANPISYPDLKFTDASPVDSARIRGDWERLQAIYVRDIAPDLVTQYRSKAHETLRHANKRKSGDPRLAAVLGLAELDGGDTQRARELLERAVHAQVVRPKAYIELARLQLEEALAHPAADGKLTREQADPILQLLAATSRQSPQLPDAYRLCLSVWEHCAASPGPADLRLLAEGTKAFPRSAELAYRTAKLHLAADRSADALALVQNALRLGANDAYAQPLHDLLASLTRAER